MRRKTVRRRCGWRIRLAFRAMRGVVGAAAEAVVRGDGMARDDAVGYLAPN